MIRTPTALKIALAMAAEVGKLSEGDRARFLQIALGSALECSATLDVLTAKGVLETGEVEAGKELVERVVAMLMVMLRKLGKTVDVGVAGAGRGRGR